MQISRHDTIGGRGVTLIPSSGSYSRVVLWFHGLGDDASGWAEFMPELNLPDTKFILPTAPTRPITLNGGMPMPGWSDIYGLDELSEEDLVGFNQSADRVNTIVQQEIEGGILPSNIFIGGFSQGGALALHYSLRYPLSLGGCIALSTWVPFRSDYPGALSESAKSLPIVQIHGSEDRVVPFAWGSHSNKLLQSMITNPSPKFLKIEGMGHSSHPNEFQIIRTFILNSRN